jgi:uncharacterized membrane protein YciS (DUF1049 family)
MHLGLFNGSFIDNMFIDNVCISGFIIALLFFSFEWLKRRLRNYSQKKNGREKKYDVVRLICIRMRIKRENIACVRAKETFSVWKGITI